MPRTLTNQAALGTSYADELDAIYDFAEATYFHECHIKAPAPSLREYCGFHGRCTVTESSIGAI